MPHLKLKYTNNIKEKIDFPKLFLELHQVLANIGKIKIANCKSRATKLDIFYIAEGQENQAFIHIDLSFLEGRSLETKQEIGKKFIETLKTHYSKSIKDLDLQITVEIKDIAKSTYYKFPEGTFTVL